MRPRPTAARPPHPAARQWARSPDGLPDVVLCTGAAEHYEDNIHEALKLVLVPDAPFEIRRRGTRHRADPGHLIALHADEAHAGGPWPTSHPAQEHAGTDAGWLLLCFGPTTLATAGVADHLTLPDPVLRDRTVATRYRRLHRILESPAPTLAKEAAIAQFVALVAQRGPSDPVAGSAQSDRNPGLAAARAYLGDQLARNVTLTELTGVAGMSPYQLVRAFTARFGLPPHTLHLRLRLDRAQDLLRQGQLPTDVAHVTGFADQAHFTRRFKRLYGVTPGHYQKASQSRPGG